MQTQAAFRLPARTTLHDPLQSPPPPPPPPPERSLKMGAIRLTPIDEVVKFKSLRARPDSDAKTSSQGEIRLSSGGVQVRVVQRGPCGVTSSSTDTSSLSPVQTATRLRALAYRSTSASARGQETAKEAFMLAVGLRPQDAAPPAPTTKAHVVRVLGGLKAIKSFLRSPITPLPRVACMSSYLRHKGALVHFAPPAPQTKPKAAKSGKMKKTQPKFPGKKDPAA